MSTNQFVANPAYLSFQDTGAMASPLQLSLEASQVSLPVPFIPIGQPPTTL